ncbi:MAG: hypothetical protein ACM3ML_01390 [Micromonosporaceae bacterium]
MTTTTTAPAAAPGGGLVPARPLAAQAHALRAAAALIERAGIAGPSLTIGEQITIQVPARLAGAARAAAVEVLAAATGGQAVRETRPGPTRGWVLAEGQLAGHPVQIFTPIGHAP